HMTQWDLRCFYPEPGQEALADGNVPYQEMSPKDDQGRWNLDVVRIQDYMAYTAQGEIVDRTQEHLGGSDQGVILFRQMLLEQLDLMQEGGDPMNVFRHPAANESINVPVISRGYRTKAGYAVTR